MSAATSDRATQRRGTFASMNLPVGAQKVYAGVLAMVNTAGHAVMGAATATLKAVGIFGEQVDNSAGSGGELSAEILSGECLLGNSAGADEITNADIGKVCYVVDNQTVARTSAVGTRPVAGIVTGLKDGQVFVDVRPGIQDDSFEIVFDVKDTTGASALVYHQPAPRAGELMYKVSVLEGGALATADATLTSKIGAVAVTGGVITITQAASAAGDVDSAVPTAAKSFAAGAALSETVGGGDTAGRAAKVVWVCKPQ